MFDDVTIRRFWGKVDKRGPDECWPWLASLNSAGYGQISIRRRPVRAHRISFLLSFGSIKEGNFICHKCDNPLCVNPAHLFQGTPADNVADMIAKGRMATPDRRGARNAAAKLSEEDALFVKASAESGVSLAARFGVSPTAISCCRLGKTWKHL